MKKNKKIVALLLTVIMLLSALMSCKKEDASVGAETTAVPEETVDLWAELPKKSIRK